MTQKSKPNNAGFTNRQEFLAGEDFLPKSSGARTPTWNSGPATENMTTIRENIAQHSEEARRQQETGATATTCTEAATKIVLTITLQTKPIKRGNTDCRRFTKMPPIKFATKAMRRVNAWSLQSKLSVGSKNYTICKVHVRNIFPTDWGQPQPLHHEQQWVLQLFKTLFYNEQLRTPIMCDIHGSVPFVNKIRTEQNFRLQFLLHLFPQNHSKLNIYT